MSSVAFHSVIVGAGACRSSPTAAKQKLVASCFCAMFPCGNLFSFAREHRRRTVFSRQCSCVEASFSSSCSPPKLRSRDGFPESTSLRQSSNGGSNRCHQKAIPEDVAGSKRKVFIHFDHNARGRQPCRTNPGSCYLLHAEISVSCIRYNTSLDLSRDR